MMCLGNGKSSEHGHANMGRLIKLGGLLQDLRLKRYCPLGQQASFLTLLLTLCDAHAVVMIMRTCVYGVVCGKTNERGELL